MKNITALMLCAASLAFIFHNSNAASSGSPHHSKQETTVAHIIDGDTFVTTRGDHVRLIGINTPERGKNNQPADPYYTQAKQALTKLIKNQNVTLKFGQKKKDKYKRLLADVYLANGTWVNAELIKQGAAHVYSFPDTANSNTTKLLNLEETARTQNRGLWALPRWQIHTPDSILNPAYVGQFHLVEGKITSVADVKKRLYLNFGSDWRTDFTAEIRPQDRKKFPNKSAFMGKTVLVRGIIKPVNGMMLTLTHPQQIDIQN